MIFLSHNHKDKSLVEQIAVRLKESFGQQSVFYDSWSIQPGDGIIDKMNEALGKCNLFLFFVSKNSLQSNLVKLEWQNAVMKSASGQCRIVPVKLDDCLMPPILLQSLYVDLFGQGIEVALRQIVDISSGANTFMPSVQNFSNVRAVMARVEGGLSVRVEAVHYMEPISHYLFLTKNSQEDFRFSYKSESMCNQGFQKDVKLNSGELFNAQVFSVEKSTVPGFPLIVEFEEISSETFTLSKVMHEKKMGEWLEIPLT